MAEVTIDHIVLRVCDFNEAAKFYRLLNEFLDWEEVMDSKDATSIGFRSTEGFTLWVDELDNVQIGADLGHMDHLAFHCASKEQVDKAYGFCIKNNIAIISEPKAYPEYGDFYGFSFRGVEGIVLEFVTR